MGMSARNYRRIAAAIRREHDDATTNNEEAVRLDMVVYRLANMFEEDNPRFDRARFYRAATGHEEVKGWRGRGQDG
jgi:hypothetical protein